MATKISDPADLERRYRLLFDHVPCYVAVIDRRFRVLDSNHLFRKTFWRDSASRCYEMYKGRGRPCRSCPAREAFRSGRPCTSLQAGQDRQGRPTHYMLTAAPLETDDRGVQSVIEMAQDVSQVMMLEERLKQVEQEKLEAERLAVVGQTVAGLAHGVRNILTGLQGGMYVVDSGLKRGDNELVAGGWAMVQNNVNKISTAVREYLEFAKGSAIRVESVSPARIAAEALESFADRMRDAGVEVTARLDETIEDARMDPVGLRACLSHLLSNALDACVTSEKRKKRVRLVCMEKDGIIVYEVLDNGTGMDAEVKRKAFRSFFSTKASGQGTGLGLLVTRRIVGQHGGKVGCESSPGKGSTFRIELPRNRLPGQAGRRGNRSGARGGKS